MASSMTAEIRISDLRESSSPRPASITEVKHLSSYNWIEGDIPAIAVPGLPRLWTPPKGPQKLRKDSGLVYIAENPARHPASPIEPLFRSIFLAHPSFHLGSVDVITDRNNIRKLLQFVNPGRGTYKAEAFTINVELVKETAIFGRTEAVISEHIAPHEFRGYGHQFEKKYTTSKLSGYSGHFRIISYRFCGMSFIVRHETDGYTEGVGCREREGDGLSDLMGHLSLTSKTSSPSTNTSGTGLRVEAKGRAVPLASTLEIKTRTKNKPLSIDEVAPQLWASQTPKLVRAYHDRGTFVEPIVEDVSTSIRTWEAINQSDLMKLGALIKQIVLLTKSFGGKVTIKYEVGTTKLIVQKNADMAKMLPEDIYAMWNKDKTREKQDGDTRLDGSEGIKNNSKAAIAEVDKDTLPEQLISFGNYDIPDSLPFGAIIRSGIAKGFRQFFRDMPTDLKDYCVLCKSLDAAHVDVLQGRRIRDLTGDMRRGKDDWDPVVCRKIAGTKSVARNSAFQLLYILLQRGEDDRNAAYNATLFVVSHSRIFSSKTRMMVRRAFEYKSTPSPKQTKELDKWPVQNFVDEDDATTEEDATWVYWDSDYS
jgi:hypothetical protein